MMKRILFFAYGTFSYLIFLGTFLYAIGFIGNFGVPRTLDGPATGSLLISFAIDAGLLTLFAVQHSVMARKWFKEWWTRIVPKPIERSTYVLFSSVALIVLFALWRPLGGVIWSVEDPPVDSCCAVYLLLAGDWSSFDVPDQPFRFVWTAPGLASSIGPPRRRFKFTTPGPYRLVRHPLYVGWLFAFWMTPVMTSAHLLFSIATTAYILLAIQFEERDLVREHGETYEEYRKSVPMLVPSVRMAKSRGLSQMNAD